MGRGRSESRRRLWRDLIGRQRKSGMSVAAFCRDRGVSAASFYNWRAKLAEEPASGEPVPVSFVPLPMDQVMRGIRAAFSVRLPNGVKVVVPNGFDAESLAAIAASRQRPVAWPCLTSRIRRACFFVPSRLICDKSSASCASWPSRSCKKTPPAGTRSCFLIAAPIA